MQMRSLDSEKTRGLCDVPMCASQDHLQILSLAACLELLERQDRCRAVYAERLGALAGFTAAGRHIQDNERPVFLQPQAAAGRLHGRGRRYTRLGTVNSFGQAR